MPAFNAGQFIADSMRSVLAQDWSDFELLVIDDGSTDDTANIVSGFDDQRVRLLRHEENRGLVATLNEGLREARAPLVARQDADDLCRADRFSRQLAHFDACPDDLAVASEAQLVDDQNRRCGILRLPRTRQQLRWDLCFRNPIPHSSVMMRRQKLLAEFGGYPESVASEDYALWSSIAATARVGLIKRSLVSYRIHSSSVMMTSGKTAADIAQIRGENMEKVFGGLATHHQLGLLARSWENPAGILWEDYVPAFESVAAAFEKHHGTLGSVPGIEYQTLIASGAPSALKLLRALSQFAPYRLHIVPWHRIIASAFVSR
jgi:glycosyltransferase involved in cell wall biosynthesis